MTSTKETAPASEKRAGLSPPDEMRQEVLDNLRPNLAPDLANALRTRLNLPAPSATNSPAPETVAPLPAP